MQVSTCALLQGLSIACSTPEAIAWDETWANTHEISGRAMKAVHDSGSGFQVDTHITALAQKKAAANGMANGIAHETDSCQ